MLIKKERGQRKGRVEESKTLWIQILRKEGKSTKERRRRGKQHMLRIQMLRKEGKRTKKMKIRGKQHNLWMQMLRKEGKRTRKGREVESNILSRYKC
jgi:hypothetical protein